ncbi:3-isopropylmalate dehydratase large subunit [Miniphocaeibacter halophilus]|uniref:3-isopropylmalate dehydratase large subunit n=1 Tax=Miniphocaeibacter halophilus TaxID=2931922 RepID=A0AC61MTU5_9FIRM|nr:3-isopropylmalate dehydratase large subunit [Miniphocaeibacter halophilus]QQK08264.1 3-isopropylmalate dehydratase large subunit [Miniphocaeibacter halophilus]
MGMTMTQKILAKHAGLESVKKDQFIMAKLDMVLGNDITTPVAINEFHKMTDGGVFDKEKIAIVLDHFVPAKDIKSATQAKKCKEFAREYGVKNFFEVGRSGIEHALLPEKGLVKAGDVIIGADSHTCTYGALGAFSTGVGSTDMAAGMATGEAWFKVPGAIKFNLTGKLNQYVTGKDLILHIIGMIGVDGARYKSMEFMGEGASTIEMDDRFSICNMAIEAGAKNGTFPVDDKTRQYMKEHGVSSWEEFYADDDAEYEKVYNIDLSEVKMTVAFPHLPENARTIDEVGNIEIQQVVIGSCTNGRIKDMREAAEILKGKTIAEDLRCIIIPATQEIYKQCVQEGLAEIFIDAGCVFSTPTCGPCLGGYMGILADGERCVSTTNRNFVGRMGHTGSEVYLASPVIAAYSAIAGKIAGPESN